MFLGLQKNTTKFIKKPGFTKNFIHFDKVQSYGA